jgi:RNA polymerase sigma factor (sigma-70 family)
MGSSLPPGLPFDRAPLDFEGLVDRIARGDPAAEEELVLLFQRDVFRLLRGRTRNYEVSQELSNDALMAVVCALRNRRLRDATKLRAFVHGTVRNLANNYLRSRFARPIEEPLDIELAAARSADGVEQDDRMAFLERGLSQLASTDRQILLLTMIEGLKPGEIARRLGVSPGTARTRKSRALHRLIARVGRSDA